MNSRNKFGLILAAIGIFIMLLPFVSGFTGFFSFAFKFDINDPSFHFPILQAMIIGFVIAMVGLLFIKKEAFV